MPQELPGFYYDPEKNRYFPVKGPIPGSTHHKSTPPPPQKPPLQPTKVQNQRRRDARVSKLLHNRELYGNVVNFSNRKGSFQEEFKKKLASQPKVWKYEGLDRDGDGGLTLVNISVQTPVGQCRADALLTGSTNGSLSLFDVGNVEHRFNHGIRTTPDYVWPESDEPDCSGTLKDIWKLNGATLIMPSSISCISMPRKEYFHGDNDGSDVQRALITTLGSESSGGSLYTLNLSEPVVLNSSIPAVGRLRDLASLNCTVWSADSICSSSRAVVGTNLGATLVDLESGTQSTVFRSKSDVLSVQFIQSGNVVLCGLRNGAIVTVDVRQRPRLSKYRIPYPSREVCGPSSRNAQKMMKPWFMVKGNIQPSCTIYMPSSISCLLSLRLYDQYFLASSMDGSIKLYDHRLTQRGPIQSYEGHVNSHSRIQLSTDACERFLMSGGDDCKVRIWSLKSGQMLFQEKLLSSIPATVCWQGSIGFSEAIDGTQSLGQCLTRSCEAWLGSAEGLLRMRFS